MVKSVFLKKYLLVTHMQDIEKDQLISELSSRSFIGYKYEIYKVSFNIFMFWEMAECILQ